MRPVLLRSNRDCSIVVESAAYGIGTVCSPSISRWNVPVSGSDPSATLALSTSTDVPPSALVSMLGESIDPLPGGKVKPL